MGFLSFGNKRRYSTYASGKYMASLKGMTQADKKYYLSKKYKGNQKKRRR